MKLLGTVTPIPNQQQARAVRPWRKYVAVITFLIACGVPFITSQRLIVPIDDVFITLTYARSVADGDGFRFHPDAEAYFGTTTPLNTIVLATLHRIAPNITLPRLAIIVSAAFWIAHGGLFLRYGDRFGLTSFERLSVAILTTVMLPKIVILGFEYHLLMFLILITFLLYLGGRYRAAGVGIALAYFTRGEGILLFLVLLFDIIRTHRGGPVTESQSAIFGPTYRILQGMLLILIPATILIFFHTGDPLPGTLSAKIAQVISFQTHQPFRREVLAYLNREWAPLGYLTVLHSRLNIMPIMAMGGILLTLLYRPTLSLYLTFLALFSLGYSLLDVAFYGWYTTPIAYILTIFAALVPHTLYYLQTDVFQLQRPIVRALPGAFAITLTLGMSISIARFSVPQGPVQLERNVEYRNLATWFNENASEGATIAFFEVGNM
ncbi:MAG: hypothetical protein AAF125_21270, partial [Chloroflexota bacterium]